MKALQSRQLIKHACLLAVCVLAGAVIFCCGLAACSSTDDDPVVARINGEELRQSLLASYVDSVRDSIGSSTNEALEAYLSDQGTTPDDFWQALIDFYGVEIVVTQRCEELGIEATEEELESLKSSYMNYYGLSDEEDYLAWLASSGISEAQMEVNLSYSICLEKLYEAEVPREDPTEEQIQASANSYYSYYASKRSSFIYFPDGTYDTAQTVLKELLADPDADFAEYARTYSQHEDTAAEGGDVGWSAAVYLPDVYLEALELLEVGDITESTIFITDGYYIIKCTDEYIPELDEDGNLDLSLMPDQLYETLLMNAENEAWTEACEQYLEDLYAQADVEILISSFPL